MPYVDVHCPLLSERIEGAAMVRRITVSTVRERIGDVLTHVALQRERIILTRHGREIGAIVPMEDLARLHALDADEQEDGPLTPYRTSWRRLTDSIRRRH